VALCAAVRLAFLFLVTHDYARLPVDVDRYGQGGVSLATGRGLRFSRDGPASAIRPPVYPLFLAGIHLLGLGATAAPLMAQAALDAATCVLVFLLTREISGGDKVGARAAAFAWALYFPEVTLVARLWSEPLGALLTTAALLALICACRSADAPRPVAFVFAGVCLGAAALTRAAMLPPALALTGWVFFGRGALSRFPRRLAGGAAMLSGFLLVISPWLVRNALVFRALVPGTTHGGKTMYEGNCALDEPDFLRAVHPPEARAKFERELEARSVALGMRGEAEVDRLYYQEAGQLIRAHPARFALLSLVRFGRLWFNVGYGHPPSSASVAVGMTNLVLLLVAAAGLRRRRCSPSAAPVIVLVGGVTLVHMATVAYVRYSMPLIPAILGLAAAGAIRGRGRRA
jgi:hypothetical protein